MPRSITSLTDSQIRNAKPTQKVYYLADGYGLLLRIRPTGAKSWIFNYRKPFIGTRTGIGLGVYPTVSLKEARKKRSEARELLARDIDPKAHWDQIKKQQADSHKTTLHYVATQWFEVKRTKTTENHGRDIWASLDLHIFPKLGNIPLDKLKATTVIDAIKPVAAKGSLETVKRLCQRLNEIMTFALNTGLAHHNPLAGIRDAFETPAKQHMPTLEPAQLPELMTTLNHASIKRTTRCLIEWQLHTITRPGEAAGTRWDELDFDNQIWHIPAERMKRKKAHSVPLTPQALALLETMKPISQHREHVFPADRNPQHHINSSTGNMALKRMGYGGVLVAHGLRALASTTLNEQGFDPDVIESALSHTGKNEVRSAYNHAQYIERRRTMMIWWSDQIEKAATGNFSVSRGRKSLHLV